MEARVEAIHQVAHPLTGAASDYDPLLSLARGADLVLLGEASHGTHQFYRERALITRRLVAELGFNAVVAEADWPDAIRVNRFVRNERTTDADAEEALRGFRRFPTWMWRNADVLDFVGWLREYNDQVGEAAPKAGFYGMDLYSLHASMSQVLVYLEQVDPEAADRARRRYACFDHYGEDPHEYGLRTGVRLEESCQREVLHQLAEMQRRRSDSWTEELGPDEAFFAEQNAVLVKNAEEYYRTMFGDHVGSWNRRDRHMAETVERLMEHLATHHGRARLVLWAHNSHLGDARATQMGEEGELNVGQILRERFGPRALLVGFTTHDGTVTASHQWDQPPVRMKVRPSIPGSLENLFHQALIPRFFIDLRTERERLHSGLGSPLLERAIGVVYRPSTERRSHYFRTQVLDQFDAVIHLDHTRAVEPLERMGWRDAEVPETFPTGI
jgi:erythromycin esterase-like protein